MFDTFNLRDAIYLEAKGIIKITYMYSRLEHFFLFRMKNFYFWLFFIKNFYLEFYSFLLFLIPLGRALTATSFSGWLEYMDRMTHSLHFPNRKTVVPTTGTYRRLPWILRKATVQCSHVVTNVRWMEVWLLSGRLARCWMFNWISKSKIWRDICVEAASLG